MPYAIDLFCGAGGFSEGILQAGFDIIFSSDRSPMVEETYVNRHRQLGIIEGVDTHFELADIKELTSELIFEKINSLKYGNIFTPGIVDVIFGGPPCQGFSRLGKRDASDPRNMLFHEYLRIIRDIQPKYVVMENVTGILDMQMLDFPSVLSDSFYLGQHLVNDILKQELEGLGYILLDVQILNSAEFGVPQQRNRVVFLAYRADVYPIKYPDSKNYQTTTVADALGDLYDEEPYNYSTKYSRERLQGATTLITGESFPRHTLTNIEESKHDIIVSQRFSLYKPGENTRAVIARLKKEGINLKELAPELFIESLFQVNSNNNSAILIEALKSQGIYKEKFNENRWLHFTNRQLSILATVKKDSEEYKATLRSLAVRLSINLEETTKFLDRITNQLNSDIDSEEFEKLLLNGHITDKMGEAILTRKSIRTRLNPNSVSPTVVTLPDDYIHPYFNRSLTVREMARLQSFDDSFEFLGKRTTGGDKRAQETPQFTQVGNAVPPLLAKVIAEKVREAIQNN